jgi:hypothetical protein
MDGRTGLLRVLTLAAAICGFVVSGMAGSGGAATNISLPSAATSHASGARTVSVPTASSNRSAAAHNAERLLSLAVLPPGATRVSTEPRGDDKLLDKPPSQPTGQIVDRSDWWHVPAAFASVVAFLAAHPPSGSAPGGSGDLSGPGVPDNQMRSFSFPPIGAVVSMRTLSLDAVALRGGATGIRVDAQETWIVPRLAVERVPPAAHEVEVTSVRPGTPSILSWNVTNPGHVRRIISLIDAMPIVQPGFYGCPVFSSGQPIVTFDFRAAVGQPVLAQASLTDASSGSGQCNPVSFSIRKHRQKPLIGGNFLSQVERLLGVRFR